MRTSHDSYYDFYNMVYIIISYCYIYLDGSDGLRQPPMDHLICEVMKTISKTGGLPNLRSTQDYLYIQEIEGGPDLSSQVPIGVHSSFLRGSLRFGECLVEGQRSVHWDLAR